MPTTFDFKHADYEAMEQFLYTVDWGLVFSTCLCANDYWSAFAQVLDEVVERFVPIVKATRKNKLRYPIKIRWLMAKKRLYWKMWKKPKQK